MYLLLLLKVPTTIKILKHSTDPWRIGYVLESNPSTTYLKTVFHKILFLLLLNICQEKDLWTKIRKLQCDFKIGLAPFLLTQHVTVD